MNRLRTIIPVAILTILFASESFSQKATEQFIPIGESPGLSGVTTYIGRIQGYDAASGTLTLNAGGAPQAVRITDDTNIWLDRSAWKLSNLEGDASDLQAGRRAEVSYVDPTVRDVASWVKVETGN